MLKQQKLYEVKLDSTCFVFNTAKEATEFFEFLDKSNLRIVQFGDSDYDVNPTRYFKYVKEVEISLQSASTMELFESQQEEERAYKAYEVAKKMKLTKNKKS